MVCLFTHEQDIKSKLTQHIDYVTRCFVKHELTFHDIIKKMQQELQSL